MLASMETKMKIGVKLVNYAIQTPAGIVNVWKKAWKGQVFVEITLEVSICFCENSETFWLVLNSEVAIALLHSLACFKLV